MDSKLVSSDLLSLTDIIATTIEGERGLNRSSLSFSYNEIFEEKFPYYLSIGMTYDQYWNDDPKLTRFYRKAEKLRQERMNEEKWLQGMYIYDALQRLTPIFKAFPKKGVKPMEYPTEPYPLDEKAAEDLKKKEEEKQMAQGKAFMESFMVAHNKSNKEGK